MVNKRYKRQMPSFKFTSNNMNRELPTLGVCGGRRSCSGLRSWCGGALARWRAGVARWCCRWCAGGNDLLLPILVRAVRLVVHRQYIGAALGLPLVCWGNALLLGIYSDLAAVDLL